MAENDEADTSNDSDATEGEMTEAEIDQTLKDSFPASDPPSWTLGSNHSENANRESEKTPGDGERETDD